jgi:nucleoid DNA-binding protein
MIGRMNKKKIVKDIVYKDLTIDQFKDLVNKSQQIKLSGKNNLINEIHDRYPLISLQETSLIVKAFFDVVRECLISGEIINFNKTFSNMQLLIYKHRRNNRDYISIKVKISTPAGIK